MTKSVANLRALPFSTSGSPINAGRGWLFGGAVAVASACSTTDPPAPEPTQLAFGKFDGRHPSTSRLWNSHRRENFDNTVLLPIITLGRPMVASKIAYPRTPRAIPARSLPSVRLAAGLGTDSRTVVLLSATLGRPVAYATIGTPSVIGNHDFLGRAPDASRALLRQCIGVDVAYARRRA